MASMTNVTVKRKPPEIKYVTLSSFEQHHYELALKGHQPICNEKKLQEKDPLNEFTCFLKLPVELQDMVWNFYVNSNPRVVTLRNRNRKGQIVDDNERPLITQINRKLRHDAMTRHGYIEFTIPYTFPKYETAPTPHENGPCKFVFHPEMDMLYIRYERHGTYNLNKGVMGAEFANLMPKIKCIAVSWHMPASAGRRRDRPYKDMMDFAMRSGLKELSSVNFVAVVRHGFDGRRYRAVGIPMFCPRTKHERGGPEDISRKKSLEERLVRGAEALSPYVVMG